MLVICFVRNSFRNAFYEWLIIVVCMTHWSLPARTNDGESIWPVPTYASASPAFASRADSDDGDVAPVAVRLQWQQSQRTGRPEGRSSSWLNFKRKGLSFDAKLCWASFYRKTVVSLTMSEVAQWGLYTMFLNLQLICSWCGGRFWCCKCLKISVPYTKWDVIVQNNIFLFILWGCNNPNCDCN